MNTALATPEPSFPLPAAFGRRLVTLPDGRPGLRATLHLDIRAPSPEALASRSPDSPPPASPDAAHELPILDFVASNETLDRCDEVIAAGGWRLHNYRRNPVFQNAHQYGDIIFTLGKALITEVRSGSEGSSALSALPSPYLFQRIEFAVEANPMARIAYGLYRGKFLNAVSVGFIPLRWKDNVGQASAPAGDGGVAPPVPRRTYLEQELLEVSAVGIPANPDALQLGLDAGAIQKADLRDLLDLLRLTFEVASPATLPAERAEAAPDPALWNLNSLSSPTAAPNAFASAPGVRSDGAQLLQLARALRDLLRRT